MYNFCNIHIVSSNLGKLSLYECGALSLVTNIKINIKNSFLYLCGVDLDKFSDVILDNSSFIIYQGSFYSHRIDSFVNLILPTSVYTEGVYHYLI